MNLDIKPTNPFPLSHNQYILNAKILAPLSISIFFLFKTDYFKVQYYSDDVPVSNDHFCHKVECVGITGNS